MDLYLSYGRNDSREYAQRLASWLRILGYTVCLDSECTIPGKPFTTENEAALQNCPFIIFLISSDSIREGSICQDEIDYADTHNIAILPVRIADVPVPARFSAIPCLDACDDPGTVFFRLPEILERISRDRPLCQEPRSGIPGFIKEPPVIPLHPLVKCPGETITGREWLFAYLKSWYSAEESRVLLLTGEPGIGKSLIAARLFTRMNVQGMVFFIPEYPDFSQPDSVIFALVSQLANQFPAYRKVLGQIPVPETPVSHETLWKTLVATPFTSELLCCTDNDPVLLVLDALDEASARGGPEMLDFLEYLMKTLPSSFRIIATSRPDQGIIDRFRGTGITRLHIDARSVDNQTDVAEYVRSQVAAAGLTEYRGIVDHICILAAGNFAYARTVLASREIPGYALYGQNASELVKTPRAMPEYYEQLFRQRFLDPEFYRNEIAPLAAMLTTLTEPIPRALLTAACGPDRKSTMRAWYALSQFLTERDESVSLFHPGLGLWLKDDGMKNPYSVGIEEGSRRLAREGLREVEGGTGDISSYTLLFLIQHLHKAGMFDELDSVLREPRFIVPLYKSYRNLFLYYWKVLEDTTPLRISETYKRVVKSPARFDEKTTETVSFILHDTGYYDEAMLLFRELEEICRRMNEEIGMVRFRVHQAAVYRYWGCLEESLAILKKTGPLLRNLGDEWGLAYSLSHEGLISCQNGDFDAALRQFREQDEICRKNQYTSLRMEALAGQFQTFRSMGLVGEAGSVLDEMERYSRIFPSSNYRAKVEYTKALFLMDKDRCGEAVVLLRVREQACRTHLDRRELSICLGNMGLAYQMRGKFPQAKKSFADQEKLCRDLSDRFGLAGCLGNQGCIYLAEGDLERARELFMDQEQFYRELNHAPGLAASLANQAVVQSRLHNTRRALRLADQALHLAQERGNVHLIAGIRSVLDDMQGDTREG